MKSHTELPDLKVKVHRPETPIPGRGPEKWWERIEEWISAPPLDRKK